MNARDGVAQRTQGNNDVVTAVGLSNVPEAIRSADTLARPDYVDCFTATAIGATDKSAEEWARALLEDTPTGRSAPSLWRLLGLRLGPIPSTDYVQGWKIADRADDWIRIETTSRFMTAHAVVRVDDGQLAIALFVRYDRRIAALIWPPVSVMHRRAVPVMLRQALKRHASQRCDIGRRDPPMSNSTMIEQIVDRWHQHLRGDLPGGLDALLADDVVFYSPIVFTPQRGKATAKQYLHAAAATLPGPPADSSSNVGAGGFHYTKQILAGDTAVLEFETTMQGKHVNGVDIIRAKEGRIIEFRVMIRPLQAINIMHEQMRAALEALP
jgi:hypothetical protein